MKLSENQLNDVQLYCKTNDIPDVNKFILKCFTEGFNIQKYGLLGDNTSVKEIIVEKKVEVPVEIIKEVEKIKEIPIETIRKVPDDEQVKGLNETIQQMKKDFEKERESFTLKIKELNDGPKKDTSEKEKLLQQTLIKLKKEVSLKNKKILQLEDNIEKIKIENQPKGASYLRGSNLNN